MVGFSVKMNLVGTLEGSLIVFLGRVGEEGGMRMERRVGLAV